MTRMRCKDVDEMKRNEEWGFAKVKSGMMDDKNEVTREKISPQTEQIYKGGIKGRYVSRGHFVEKLAGSRMAQRFVERQKAGFHLDCERKKSTHSRVRKTDNRVGKDAFQKNIHPSSPDTLEQEQEGEYWAKEFCTHNNNNSTTTTRTTTTRADKNQKTERIPPNRTPHKS